MLTTHHPDNNWPFENCMELQGANQQLEEMEHSNGVKLLL
jgi:hypothetical protein